MATAVIPQPDSLEAALACNVCMTEFDAMLHRPLVLPRCGHTFCRLCVKNLAAGSAIVCPSCRTQYQDMDVDQLPINFNIQCLSRVDKIFPKLVQKDSGRSSGTECIEHRIRLSFWCRSCEVAACGECLYDLHPQPTHDTCRLREVIQQIKERAENLSQESSQQVVVRLGEAMRGALAQVSDLQEAAHLIQEAARVRRNAVNASDLPSITSVFQAATTMWKRVDALGKTRREEDPRCDKCAAHDEVDNTTMGVAGEASEVASGTGEVAGGTGEVASGTGEVAGGTGEVAGGTGEVAGEASEVAVEAREVTGEAREVANEARTTTAEVMSVVTSRPSILALSENGSLAKVEVKAKGIHVHCLQPPSTAYSVAIKLNILTACMSKEAPTVFLDVRAGERALGRVYIQLLGQMRRAQQFLALCLGNLTPNYRNTKFDGINEMGKPGEYLRGGDYTNRGGFGGEAIMDNLEWGGSWSRPKRAGQVCGVGGEEGKKYGALFAICLQDNPDDVFRCPFGEVTEGLEVLKVAARHDPFHLVRISDCGVVIPL